MSTQIQIDKEQVEEIRSKIATETVASGYEELMRQLSDKVEKESIPWEGYFKANLIFENELDRIRKYDKASRENRVSMFQKEPEALAEVFLELLVKLNKEETLQYILLLMDQLFSDCEEATTAFLNLSKTKPSLPFEPLIRLLGRQDKSSEWFTVTKASHLIAALMSKSDSVRTEDVKYMANWIKNELAKLSNVPDKDKEIYGAILCLQRFLRKNSARLYFANEGGIEVLYNLLKNKIKLVQLAYQITFCLWLSSYERKAAEKLSEQRIVQFLIEILRTPNMQEKTMRMALATLRNLLNIGDANSLMIECGIGRPLDVLAQRTWKDDDIKDDLQVLTEALAQNLAELTSFDIYKQEIMSGQLEWSSPSHRSEKFWRENVHRFEEDGNKILLALKGLLSDNGNATTVAIACFDIGEFARFHPRGKALVQTLGIKVPLMKLMEDGNPEIRKQALLAIQKVMVTNWFASASLFN